MIINQVYKVEAMDIQIRTYQIKDLDILVMELMEFMVVKRINNVELHFETHLHMDMMEINSINLEILLFMLVEMKV